MGLNGGSQECMKNFGEETSWNMITGRWEAEMGISDMFN
jgi:hypothetical protein